MASATSATFDNSTAWYNLTAWTAQLGYAMNMSKLAPSFEDLVWAGPRMMMKLGKLGSLISIPDAIDGFGQHALPEPTDPGVFRPAAAAAASAAGTFMQSTTSAPIPSVAVGQDPSALASRFSLESARGLGSIFSYATSRWAICCIAMAVIINRTHIFAATRRRLRLRWHVRLLLRLPPILLLLWQAQRLLQSIQCQTSPDFAELRWGNASKSSDLMFSQTNGFLGSLSSALLFGATDEESCHSVRMVPWDDQVQPELRGSLSRLWPLFVTLCFSQFIEVVSCTVQGRPMAAETGMTLFEHSLAFAEADAAVSSQLGWGMFSNGANASQVVLGQTIAVTRAMIMRRVNTPPEVLLVAFLSAMSHVTSHVLGLMNLQSRFRLVSTGFWALCFMASITWSLVTFSLDDASGQGFLRYPTVCIIGFIPHLLVFAGILVCGFIYLLTLILSALATPEVASDGRQPTFKDRLVRAHGNMQANISLSDIRIRMDMDFYTALLRAGFGAITMASEAVYLNEDRRVSLKQYTWLEEERFREVEELRMQWIEGGIPGSRFDTVGSIGAIGLVPIKDGQANATSGYAREKAAQKISKNSSSARSRRDGVGAAERSSRWLMALDYIMHISRLILTTWALITVKFLSLFGVRNPPRWLRFSQRTKVESLDNKRSSTLERATAAGCASGASGDTGAFAIPRTERVDVEAELRQRLSRANEDTSERWKHNGPVSEAEVDSRLYKWWLNGGWWGTTDTSGDYSPPARQIPTLEGPEDQDFDFDDTTSVISTTESTVSEYGWESDSEILDEGQRTPTQRSQSQAPYSFAAAVAASTRSSRESTPLVDSPMAVSDLARLLHPQSPEEREEARALAAHLSSDRIMTRSRFKQHLQQQRSQVLLTNRQRFRIGPEQMSPEEEARRLEQILLSRRGPPPSKMDDGADETGIGGEQDESWATGAAGLGPDGPQCVVCQCAPRTIIVWPCRCLSLCDDCRVSLAMNNFDKCVCCRREVISFSRIYVP
ncbi:hypothetical protein B0T19DRAFT_401872 [Cercophora scortea]|uniref:Uncharacterized protein n=1 Tax=Cercophora scortea TaxID=314031 RepID=A0AAE0M8T5_9PEZI|nr:hypothetical protein B0T19DRAFT_401872 [Cercophora scortea]